MYDLYEPVSESGSKKRIFASGLRPLTFSACALNWDLSQRLLDPLGLGTLLGHFDKLEGFPSCSR